MKRRGICPQCHQERWLGGKGGVCKPCAYPVGPCHACTANRKLYVDGLCYLCYQHRQVLAKIIDVEKVFKPQTDYNRYLFQLYLTYVKRYRLSYFHIRQAKRLKVILETDSWSTIRCSKDVYRLSERYELAHPNGKDNGCAVKKIGYMLQELGILQSKDEDLSYSIEKLLDRFDGDFVDVGRSFAAWLIKSNRAEATIYNNLRQIIAYAEWLQKAYPNLSLNSTTEAKIIEYLGSLRNLGHRTSQIRTALLTIRRLYAWLLYQQKISSNPCEYLDITPCAPKIVVASSTDFKKLSSYIQKETSPSAEALVLLLIMYFGFKTEDLLHAMVDLIGGEDFQIILRQKPRTYGRHYHHRDQILALPNSPRWLHLLKQRFIKTWQQDYAKTTQSYPTQRLILPRHRHYTRPINQITLLKRLYQVSVKVTGKRIPPKVLRQSCGDLYSKNGDGSLLARLGWSPSFAFHYTWLPRCIFAEEPPFNSSKS